MPKLWYGSDHTGTNTTTRATSWISVTLARPTARQAMNGKRPFVVKKLGWKVCAAPSVGQKMHARISSPDGSVYDNSYIGNTIAWQKAAKTVYEFPAINMHFDDDGGSKLRCWLVSGGPFYFARTTSGGSIQTPGSDFAGVPVGWLEYVEVAQAPSGLGAARDSNNLNRVTVAWRQWNSKTDLDPMGGSYGISGYTLQAARDAAFTKDVRTQTFSGGTGEMYGLYQGYTWYFRIATRNEVSEHYDLPGGQWSTTVTLAAVSDGPAVSDTSGGTATGTTDPASGADDGSSGSLSSNNPDSTSNSGGSSSTTTGATTQTISEEVTNTTVKAAKDQILLALDTLDQAVSASRDDPSSAAWTHVVNVLEALRLQAVVLAQAAIPAQQGQWGTVTTKLVSAKSAANTAATTAGQQQSGLQLLDAGKSAATGRIDTVYEAVIAAKAKKSTAGWNEVSARLVDLRRECDKMVANAGSFLTSDARAAWVKASATCSDAIVKIAAAVKSKLKSADVEKGRAAAEQARTDGADAVSKTSLPATDYSDSENVVRDAASAASSAVYGTDETTTVTRTVQVPAGTTVPDSAGDTASPEKSTPFQLSNGAPIVWAPIPDTTAQRTSNGGLLLSRSPRTPQKHVAYLMDRGGRQRLMEFKSTSLIRYNRIRDDISTAEIRIDGDSIAKNAKLLEQLSTGRHEICIFRGPERVWEGPITLVQWHRESVIVNAKDVCHYLNRTVMKNAYSNAYPNLDFVVNRIAGIIANEIGAVKEALTPPVNILPWMRTYVQDGDTRTTRVTLPAEVTVWQHLDDLAAKAGIDYTVVGRALHIWDTSRPALGRLRTVTESDFLGDTYITAYGMELATQTFVSDGQGNFGRAGGVDPYFGEVDLLATAYDENGNAINQNDADPTNDTIPIEEMTEQANRNLKGRNPTPMALKVPDGSGFRMDHGLGLDVLIPGVYVPVSATLGGKTLNQMMKLKEIKVEQDSTGERTAITLTPASDSDSEATLVEG